MTRMLTLVCYSSNIFSTPHKDYIPQFTVKMKDDLIQN